MRHLPHPGLPRWDRGMLDTPGISSLLEDFGPSLMTPLCWSKGVILQGPGSSMSALSPGCSYHHAPVCWREPGPQGSQPQAGDPFCDLQVSPERLLSVFQAPACPWRHCCCRSRGEGSGEGNGTFLNPVITSRRRGSSSGDPAKRGFGPSLCKHLPNQLHLPLSPAGLGRI